MVKEIDDSKFNMWRAIVALVHADGKQHPDEDQFLSETFSKLPFTTQQRQTLEQDLKSSKDVEKFYDKISLPADRSYFIYFARLLFWSDGDFHRQEEAIFSRLHSKTMSKVDLENVMHSVDMIAEEYSQREKGRGFRQILADFVARFFE